MPQHKPTATQRNTQIRSFAFACALRNFIKEKDPATPRPAPIFPFTSMMTIVTAAGMITSAVAKDLECWFLYI